MTDAQFLTITGLLAEIRDVLQLSLGVQDEEPVDGCPHPDENRVSFATLRDPNHWVCSLCRFDSGGVVGN